MADAIQLMNQASRDSAQFYNAIAGTAQAIERQATQQAEFQEGITRFGTQMAEQRRVSDAKISSMYFNDSLRAQAHQADMKILPLKYETEKLKLEAAKVDLTRSINQQRIQAVNNITAPYDAIVGANFSRNQNPAYAKAWLEAKSQIGEEIAAGRPVDEDRIRNTVSYIDSQFGTVSDKTGYNPEVAQLLRTMGAPTEAARYETKNPVFSGNIQGLKGASVLQGPQGVSNFLAKWGHFVDEKETTNLLIAADAIPGYDAQLESLDKQRRLASATFMQLQDGDPNKQVALDEVNRLNGEMISVRKTRDGLFKSIVSGDEYNAPKEPESENNQLFRQMAEEFRKNQERRSSLSPSAYRDGVDNPDDRSSIQSGAMAYPVIQANFPQATTGIDLNTMRGQNLRDNPEAARSLKNQIIRNLGSVEDIASLYQEALRPGKDGKSRFQKIFDKVQGNSVPVENAFRTDAYPVRGLWGADSRSDSFTAPIRFGAMNGVESFANLGKFSSAVLGKNFIESVDDLQYVINNFQGSDAQKELLLQDLYANMVLTDIVSSFK